jgi:hypothetical protein
MDQALDLELILDEALNIQQTCESPIHPGRVNGHRNSGNLYYVQFYCWCAGSGPVLRCGGWIRYTNTRSSWVCGLCGMDVKTDEWFTVLDAVDPDV